MCQAIPRRVLHTQAAPPRVQVDYDGEARWFEAGALEGGDLQVGEYVVVYAGQVLERMAADEAEALLAWYADLEGLLEEAAGAWRP